MMFFSALHVFALSVSISCFATEFSDPTYESGETSFDSVEFLVNSGSPTTIGPIPAYGNDKLDIGFTLKYGKMSLFGKKKNYLKAKIGSKSKKVEIGKSFGISVDSHDDQNPYLISCTQQKIEEQ